MGTALFAVVSGAHAFASPCGRVGGGGGSGGLLFLAKAAGSVRPTDRDCELEEGRDCDLEEGRLVLGLESDSEVSAVAL